MNSARGIRPLVNPDPAANGRSEGRAGDALLSSRLFQASTPARIAGRMFQQQRGDLRRRARLEQPRGQQGSVGAPLGPAVTRRVGARQWPDASR